MQGIVEPGMNHFMPDLSLEGLLEFSEEFTLDGTVDGSIFFFSGALVVNKTGVIFGAVRVHSAMVFGRMDGELHVQECVLKAEAVVVGDIHSESLVIEAGASFAGRSLIPSRCAEPRHRTPPRTNRHM
ncbi:MAG: hypothetical protein GWQ05_24290 [Verrucomicrobiaceae bacterium]|nr:hypothetical protein [Verrucomicrobiaceae bacterium]